MSATFFGCYSAREIEEAPLPGHSIVHQPQQNMMLSKKTVVAVVVAAACLQLAAAAPKAKPTVYDTIKGMPEVRFLSRRV